MTVDINALWDYTKPDLSEQRFRAALDGATENEKLLLQTQIARTLGLRRDFVNARAVLAAIEPKLPHASPEVQVRYFLELGRTYASATNPESDRTPENLEAARGHYLKAYEFAARARLDFLAIDALHMMPFVDVAPDRQLTWNEKALAYLLHSDQADAKGWEGSLRNNIGYAKHLMGDYESAIAQFQLSRAAHERTGKVRNVRIADWMIAWTLRAQKQLDRALAIQLELERAWDVDGEPDHYVYEELEHLYRALGNEQRAEYYGAKFRAAK